MNLQTYINYLRHQAIHHPLLKHNEDIPGKNIFGTSTFEEVIGGFRFSGPSKEFFLRAILPTWSPTGDGSQNRKEYVGGFLIAKYHGRDSKDEDIIKALADSEGVATDIYSKMVRDSQNGHELFAGSADTPSELRFNAQSRLNVGDTNWAGWLCTFAISPFESICPEDTVWTDGGLTPIL